MKQLILGGARSGKTSLALQRAADWAHANPHGQVVYVATAQAGDDEMARRIQHHRDERPTDWLTVEEPLALADILTAHDSDQYCLLIDCLTLWITNLLVLEDSAALDAQVAQFERAVAATHATLIVVSNETGLGVVPLGALSRQFVDQSGFLHQRLAQVCDRVTLTVAGLPLELKPSTTDLQVTADD